MPQGNSFPNSAFSYSAGQHYTTGNKYYVDSGATGASDGHTGLSPKAPLATLNGAMNRVTASNGDIVFLKAGHAENVSSATSQVIDVAGVKIVGEGVGNSRPTFTYTATAGSFEVDAASTHIENVRFVTSVSAVVVGMNVDADGFVMKDCEWNFDATGDDFLIFLDIDGVNDAVIEGNTFIAEHTAGANEVFRLDSADNIIIKDNIIMGDFAVSGFVNTSDDAVCENLVIASNLIYNSDTAAAGNIINLDTACTGLIADNRCGTLDADGLDVAIDPGSCLCLENYVANAIDESGAIVPTLASTS